MPKIDLISKIQDGMPINRYEDEYIKSKIVSWATTYLLAHPNKDWSISYILYLTTINHLQTALEYISAHEPNMQQFNMNWEVEEI